MEGLAAASPIWRSKVRLQADAAVCFLAVVHASLERTSRPQGFGYKIFKALLLFVNRPSWFFRVWAALQEVLPTEVLPTVAAREPVGVSPSAVCHTLTAAKPRGSPRSVLEVVAVSPPPRSLSARVEEKPQYVIESAQNRVAPCSRAARSDAADTGGTSPFPRPDRYSLSQTWTVFTSGPRTHILGRRTGRQSPPLLKTFVHVSGRPRVACFLEGTLP